jgi:hypothetical protein
LDARGDGIWPPDFAAADWRGASREEHPFAWCYSSHPRLRLSARIPQR